MVLPSYTMFFKPKFTMFLGKLYFVSVVIHTTMVIKLE